MAEDRPFAPSARKLRRARQAGEVARSPLASSAVVLLGVGGALALGGPGWLARWRGFAVRALSGEGSVEEAMAVGAAGVFAPLAVAVVVGAAAGFLQVGPLWTTEPLGPDLSRLDPGRGLRRLFAPSEIASRLLPALLGVVLVAVALAVLRDAAGLLGRTRLTPEAALAAAGAVLGALWWRGCAVLAVAGAIALVYRRWRWRTDQRMSRREVLRELRETEGDPAARRERARRRRALAAATWAEALARAALVVRGEAIAVVITWEDRARAPVIAFIARGAAAARLGVVADAPVAASDALARELALSGAGARAPRATWRRVAGSMVEGGR